MKQISLKKIYDEKLAKLEAPAKSEDMGVSTNKGRIGGYVIDVYRKIETFSDIKKRRKDLARRLKRYA